MSTAKVQLKAAQVGAAQFPPTCGIIYIMAMGKFIKTDRMGRVAADRDTPPLARSRRRWQHSTVMNPCLPSNHPVITRLKTAVTLELLALRT